MSIQQELRQQQSITQKQLQSLNILQMSEVELLGFLQNEHLENPMLEYSGVTPTTTGGSGRETDTRQWLESLPDSVDGLRESLRLQAGSIHHSDEEMRIMEYLIDNLEDTGYFTQTVDEVARTLHASKKQVACCLNKLKQLEPVGIFSANLTECLLKQLEEQGIDDYTLHEMVTNHLEDIASGHIGNISRTLHIPTAQVRRYILLITSLQPRPANGYGSETAAAIVPDILAERDGDGTWEIRLADDWVEDFSISDCYCKMMEETTDTELKTYFRERMNRAKYILDHVRQRKETLLKLARLLVEKQEAYLEGKGALKPLTMQEAASALCIAPSTVSRAVKGKYMQFPDRALAMKALFSAPVTESAGADQIKQIIREMIAEEDPAHPLSDQAITDALRGRDIKVSRRVVAKYRECMGIKGSFERKALS